MDVAPRAIAIAVVSPFFKIPKGIGSKMSIRVRIVDDEVLRNINRAKLRSYLILHGWTLGAISDYGEWFFRDDSDMCVPYESARDYMHRMYEMFQILEAVEDRSQLDIWEDLK